MKIDGDFGFDGSEELDPDDAWSDDDEIDWLREKLAAAERSRDEANRRADEVRADAEIRLDERRRIADELQRQRDGARARVAELEEAIDDAFFHLVRYCYECSAGSARDILEAAKREHA